ncbi:MAG: hypothetical protein CL460_00490 [Acidimicrobiaceae bacterium]|nr:hypothetical protein [Acidimicrobiaceae bacterium]
MRPGFEAARFSTTVRKVSTWITVVFIVFVALFIVVGRSALLDIERVEVHGLHHVTLTEIEQRLGFKQGDPLRSVDPSEAQARIEALPRVESVSISRSWNGVVTVEISEHRPVALVMSEQDKWALVASDGRVLSEGLALPPELPRISGVHAAGVPGSYLGSDSGVLLSLLGIMPRALAESFSSLRLDRTRGELSGTLNNSQEVIFGDTQRLPAKVVALSALLRHAKEQMRTAEPLNVSVPERPIMKGNDD